MNHYLMGGAAYLITYALLSDIGFKYALLWQI